MPVLQFTRKCQYCQGEFTPSRQNQMCHPGRCSANWTKAQKSKLSNELATMKARVQNGYSAPARGPKYADFVKQGWPEKLMAGRLSQREVAAAIDDSQANVSRWFKAWRVDKAIAEAQKGWIRPDSIERLLEPTPEAFAEWRSKFFTDERGRPYITPAVQMKWVAAILDAITRGRRQAILTPPRHGKTEMLIHFCIWLICREPNIRILWVGPNDEIAKQSGLAILDQLENNEALIQAMLEPETSWKTAGRTGKSWSPAKFTVATRTLTGIKSPTFAAIGKGGRLLSRDADFIVADDIVDHDAAKSPAAREDLKQWFITQLSSRKQNHTGLVAIGSRQGHHDLWGELLRNPGWSTIVEHAHDLECGLPVHGPIAVEEHGHCAECPVPEAGEDPVPCTHTVCPTCAAHHDCMLIPELATMHFLQDQRTAAQDDVYFEMVYQNITRGDGAEYLTVEHLRACRNNRRGLGLEGLPDGVRLIGGLDPAVAGFQGAVLWAWDPVTKIRHLVDLENQRAAGQPGAEALLKAWHQRYGLRTWVWETSAFQEMYLQVASLQDYCSSNGIHVYPHVTDRWNKWDVNFGVTAQMALFRRDPPLIDLPYGDQAAIDKVRVYEQQLLNFEPVMGRARATQDVLMAGWFPETQIRFWEDEVSSVVVEDRGDDGYMTMHLGDSYDDAFGESSYSDMLSLG